MHDLKQVLRHIARAPGHAATVVLTLGLAIGATTAIYSVVQGVLLEPLPFPDAARLRMLWQRAPGVGVEEDWLSVTQYFVLRERVESLEELALIFGRNVTLTEERTEPERLGALSVSSSFFPMLGIEAAEGRVFGAADDVPGTAPRVLMSSRLFERRFGSDPAVIGRTIRIDEQRLEVVGVLPSLPLDMDLMPTLLAVPSFDLVMSLPLEDPGRTTRGSENFNVLARLAPGASDAQLETELLGAAAELAREPESLGAGLEAGSQYRIAAVPWLEQATHEVRLPLVVLLVATVVLLAIACANVANLLLARSARESRQLAIRVALGAPRRHVVFRSLTESMLLALVGGAAGLLLATASLQALRAMAPAELPRMAEVMIDQRVVLFAIALSLIASLLFGLGPANRASRADPQRTLSEGASAARARSWWSGGSRYLVVAQVALSFVLLVTAGLMARSLLHLNRVDPGFRPDGALTFRLSLVGERYVDFEERRRFFESVFDRLRDLPEVSEAGGITMLPLTRAYSWTDFFVEGLEVPDGRERVVADIHVATPGYFRALGIELLAGRAFTRADDEEPPTVLVNRSFAERFWGIEDAVGKWVGMTPEERATIVGVVDDVRQYGLGENVRLAVFYPHKARATRTLYGVVRSSGDPEALAGALKAEVHRLDPNVPVYDVQGMPARLSASLTRERVLVLLLHFFCVVALVLAAVGLYGVLAFAVASHQHEIALRQALGATPKDVRLRVVKGAGAVVVAGIGIGLVVTIPSARLLDSLLFGVSARDPLTLVGACGLVLAIALAAALLPAWRAARVDPLVALNSD